MAITKTMVQALAERIEEKIKEDWDGEASFSTEFDNTFEYLTQDDEELTDKDLEELYEAVKAEVDEDEILEYFRDAEEYRRDPLGYHGMSERDFL